MYAEARQHRRARGGIGSTKDIIREICKEKKKESVPAMEWTLARCGEDELTAYNIAAPLMAADIDKAQLWMLFQLLY